MDPYSHREYYEMMRVYVQSGENLYKARRLYETESIPRLRAQGFANARVPHRQTILAAKQRLLDYGQFTLPRHAQGGGAPRLALEKEDSVLDFFKRNPRASTRDAARLSNISQASVWKLLNSAGVRPHHFQKVKQLNDADAQNMIKDKKSKPATSTTENDGKSTKSPQCDVCQKPVGALELYRCVQCPLVVMCADCGRSNAHSHHCVLRVPSLQIYNNVEYLFESLVEVFHNKLSEVDDDADDDGGDDDDSDDGSDYDDKEEEMEQELESSVHQEDDGEDHNQSAKSAILGPSKQRKSSAMTFLSSWCDEIPAPEPPDEAIPTSHIKTEPDTDPLASPVLFNILDTPTDEPKPKKRRTIMENTPKKDIATELYIDEIVGNIKREAEHEEIHEVKLESLDNDAALLDTEKYASYGSHRAGNTDF